MSVLQERIDKYNEEVRQEFETKIKGTRLIPYLLTEYTKSYQEVYIQDLKSTLDTQLHRYNEIMAFIEGYILGSGTNVEVKFEILDTKFIPELPEEYQFLLEEYEIDKKKYPDNLISVLHIA